MNRAVFNRALCINKALLKRALYMDRVLLSGRFLTEQHFLYIGQVSRQCFIFQNTIRVEYAWYIQLVGMFNTDVIYMKELNFMVSICVV